MPNQILILVDSNEYVPLIWFKRRIVLPNKIAEREWRVLNSHSSKHKLFNLISIQFGTCKMRRLNQLSKFSRIFDWINIRLTRIELKCVAFNWFRRRILHAVNLAIRFGACKMRRLNRALLSSLGMRGGKFISLKIFSSQYLAASKNRQILNIRVIAVRDT